MEFGTLLKNLREKEGVGIKRLAPVLDVSYTYLSKLENNKVRPSEEVVGRVAAYFNYSKDELLLAADKIPTDVLDILKNNPQEAIEYLRKQFARPRIKTDARQSVEDPRKSRIHK